MGVCSSKSKRQRKRKKQDDLDSIIIPRKYDPKILIVGAGAAGIACATKLLEKGFQNVIILEAGFRIGGRICTIPFADNVVDMGAEWCHGQHGNVVFDTVYGLNLLDSTGDITETLQTIRSNGEIVPEEIVKRLKSVLIDIFLNERNNLASFSGSFDSYLSENFYKSIAERNFDDIDKQIIVEFFENYKKIESYESASSLNDVSACGLLEYYVCEGDYLLNWKDKGFEKFLKVLMKSNVIGNELGILEDRILFGFVVDEIIWNRKDGMAEVICSNREQCFEADHVILTCSLGVLKERCHTLLNPAPPRATLKAIQSIGFGNACKIYLEFPSRFWPDEWTGFTTLWRTEDSEQYISTSRAWMLDVFGFYIVSYQPRVLVAWIVGIYAFIVEKLPKEEVKDGCLELIRRFLKSWEIPHPINLVVSNWQNNEFFRGCYSYRSIKTEMAGAYASELAQPLTNLVYDKMLTVLDKDGTESLDDPTRPKTIKPIVLFAGEATSQHYYSTVHGAVETGWREANRLIGYYSQGL